MKMDREMKDAEQQLFEIGKDNRTRQLNREWAYRKLISETIGWA